MKLKAQQLPGHLAKGVAPLYLVSGDEPLLVDEALAAIREAAAKSGCEQRESLLAERGFDWSAFGAGLKNRSLFAARRLVELRLPTGKPGEAGGRMLTQLAVEPDPDLVVVVITPKLDGRTQRAKWVSALEKAGGWVQLYAPERRELPKWLGARLRKAGLTADPEALELLAARVEGNLLSAKQEIDKLVLLVDGNRVTADSIRSAVTDGARFDVFQLGDAALAGDTVRAVRILRALESEGVAAPLVLWSLTREVSALADVVYRVATGRSRSQALGEAGIWRARQGLLGRAAARHDAQSVRRLVARAWQTEQIVKGARRGQPWSALLELTLELGGADMAMAETA